MIPAISWRRVSPVTNINDCVSELQFAEQFVKDMQRDVIDRPTIPLDVVLVMDNQKRFLRLCDLMGDRAGRETSAQIEVAQEAVPV